VPVVRVHFRGVGKRFGERTVLAGASGELERGRVLVISGPNGAGKSTLMNILAGVMRPSRGVVEYRDESRALERAGWFEHIGMAAPDMAVYDELSALENLEFFSRVRGLLRPAGANAGLLERLGLPVREHTRAVRTFSSGMRQRVKLAQAVLHEPAVLFLDEPSSNLDAGGHQAVAELIGEMRTRAAIAVATNDPREAAWGDAEIELAG
jgi:heme exporter protein A